MSGQNPYTYDPLNDGKSLVELIDNMGDDKRVVNAARISFSNDTNTVFIPDQDAGLLNYLARNKHSSPFQHCSVTLHVACPLFVYAQWRRHRTFNYTQINEVSRRYTSEGIEFYLPEKIRGQSESNRQASEGYLDYETNLKAVQAIKDHVESSLFLYDWLLDQGTARELARMVLPQNMYTRFYATMDLWNLYHYWTLRKDPHAQEEIRVYAEAIDNILAQLYPFTWEALKNA